MKTKLLKKVRKRYTIIKIEKLPRNSGVLKEIKEITGLPFYILKDNNGYRINDYYKEFDKARDMLIKWIIRDYGDKFSDKKSKYTKVWWVSK